jgi:hypothetical protein
MVISAKCCAGMSLMAYPFVLYYTNAFNVKNYSSHITENTFRFCYKDQPVNAIRRSNYGLLREAYERTEMHYVGRMQSFSMLKKVVHTVTTGL